MLYRGSEITREVAWVVFDEIHYMRDKGTHFIRHCPFNSLVLKIFQFSSCSNFKKPLKLLNHGPTSILCPNPI